MIRALIYSLKNSQDKQAADALIKRLHASWEHSRQYVQVWTDPRRMKVEGPVTFDRDKGILNWKCAYCERVHTCDFFQNTSLPDNKPIADHALFHKGTWQKWECQHERKSNLPAFASLETAIWYDTEALKRHSQDSDASIILSEIPPEELWTAQSKLRVRRFIDTPTTKRGIQIRGFRENL